MSTQQDEFLRQLRATFRVEAAEHLQAISSGLADIEKAAGREARSVIVETVFRAAHSLKGAARAVDFVEIESLCQSMEDTFAAWKRQEDAPPAGVIDALHRQLDSIATSLEASLASRALPEAPVPPRQPVPAIAQTAAPQAAAQGAALASEATVRITIAKLDARLVEAEEMLAAKLIAEQRVKDLRELAEGFEPWRNAWAAIEPEANAMRQALDRAAPRREERAHNASLSKLLEFLDWNGQRLKELDTGLATLVQTAQHDRYTVDKLVDDLLEDSKQLLLLPFAEIAASFPKLVRDLGRDQGKEAQLTITGENIEIDKRTLEEMKDPLVHLLRNSIAHGVETAAERARRGKPARATIEIAVARVNGSKVQITVSDDGAGIDTGKVKASAVEHGLISVEEAARLDESEARMLIFRSEVSTSPIITQLSGRGLGLAIVREKAEKLGGEVSVESRPGAGSTFRITVPATRATFRGILVEVGGWLMVVPTTQVERAMRALPGNILTVEGRETISLEGRTLPLVRLADVLELPPGERAETPDAAAPVIVLGTGEQRVAFRVDAVLDEQEVLVKPLAKPLSRVRNIAAATVLGSGQLVPILHVADLLKSARKVAGTPARVAASKKPAQARAVLVAEDSITSRMLLKGILESAGYRVRTAVDGMEAFALLHTEPFDLVVSDVEMPRLNGFDLTARIRADRKLAELPVVLVTALEAREDRERGIDVGANAYLVKSSFDQSDLLAAIRRLI
jgi:two-component system chemotaxis sensor kinase CheA